MRTQEGLEELSHVEGQAVPGRPLLPRCVYLGISAHLPS